MSQNSIRTGWFLILMLSGLIFSCFLKTPQAIASTQKLERFQYRRIVMGVPFDLTLYAESEAVANKTQISVFQRLRVLNLIFSDYDPDSELSTLCRTAIPGKPVLISSELTTVFDQSLKLSRESYGAFDITVGPVVKMWRRAKRKKIMPAEETIRKAVEKVDYRFLELNREKKQVTLLKKGIQIDLGGIAKGYACDEVIKICQENGIGSVLIDAGGDIVVGDAPPGKNGWKIGIASLAKPDETPKEFLILNNCAVATSGDAYQYVEFKGKRYSHIVDPSTGIGLTRRFSVTVIARNGTTSDSLASAVSVLGPENGIKLINGKKECEALIVESRNDRVKTYSSKKFHCHKSGESCSN